MAKRIVNKAERNAERYDARDKTVDGGRWHRTDWNKPDSTACNFVWINKWVE